MSDWRDRATPVTSGDWRHRAQPVGGADEAEEPSELESGLRGLAQGASMGFADELTGAGGALVDKLKGDKRDLSDLYKAERDDSRRHYEAAKEAHPLLYGTGNVAGNVATAIPLAMATGGTSLGALAAEGALQGGLQGLGESTGKTPGDDLTEAAKGAGLGGLAGALGGAGGKLGTAALRRFSPAVAEKLDALAAAQGRRAIAGGANPLSVKQPLADAQVLKAIDSGGIKAFDDTGRIAERLGGLREAAGQRYGSVVRGLEEAGAAGPEAGPLAQQFSDQSKRMAENSLGTGVPEMYESTAKELVTKPTDEAGRLSLTRAEDIKRSLQDAARNEYTKVGGNGMVGDAKMDIAGNFKDAIENAVAEQGAAAPEGSRLRELADQFGPVKKDVGDYIALHNAAEKGAAQAARRRAFSLSDNMMGAAAISGGLASGNPLPVAKGLGAMVGNNLLRNRGTSAVAVGARGLSKQIGKVGALAAQNPALLGKYGGALASALQRGKDAFNSAHFVLSQTDPGYQAKLKELDSVSGDDGVGGEGP